MSEVRPFTIHVPDETLDDLRARLDRARLLPDSPRRPPSGMNAAYLRELVDDWRDWDWRARESWLNGHPQFLASVGDTEVHVVHLRAADPGAPVLLVMHGWPHTFALQLELADRLAGFHVVVPSLPGFGFSPPAPDEMSEVRIADTMHRLMTEVLGYERYLTYGEDVTANISDLIAATHPDRVAGIVVTHAHFPNRAERDALIDPAEREFFAGLAEVHEAHGAYGHVQATRPDTLAAALIDSPAGLLAWLTEKLVEWSDLASDAPATQGAESAKRGEPSAVERRISRDRILTEAMIYWVTGSIATSFRPYYEGADQPAPIPPATVPAAVFVQRHEATYPESLARRHYRDLRGFERLPAGGHFTAAEVPDALAARIRAFAASVW